MQHTNEGDELRRKMPYRETLLGQDKIDENMVDQVMGDDAYTDDDSEMEDGYDEEDCLNIVLSKEEKQDIRAPWMISLILKVLGKRVGFKFLERRMGQLWNPKGTITLQTLVMTFT